MRGSKKHLGVRWDFGARTRGYLGENEGFLWGGGEVMKRLRSAEESGIQYDPLVGRGLHSHLLACGGT